MTTNKRQELLNINDYWDLMPDHPEHRGAKQCPICAGKFTKSTKSSASIDVPIFTCWSNQCPRGEIRKALIASYGQPSDSISASIDDVIQVYNPITATIHMPDTNGKNGDNDKVAEVRFLEYVRTNLEPSLQYNERTAEIEFEGQPLSMDCLRAWFADKFNIGVTQDLAQQTLLYVARQNSYDPVYNYLDFCHKKIKPIDYLDGLAHIFFGTDEQLHNEYFKRFLIGAVARVYSPGCKMDNSLLLKGDEGLLKSSFWAVLSNGFFSDSMKDVTNKDDLMLMSRHWFNEWDELERVTATNYYGIIKSFLSKSEDTYRPPYGRDIQRVPRRSVIVGSTNEDEFFNAPTGNRRFWVIPVTQTIPLSAVEQERDRIWSKAVQEYLDGQPWYLDNNFGKLQREDNRHYEQGDPWESVICAYIQSMWTEANPSVTVEEIFNKLSLEFPGAIRWTRIEQMRIGNILRRMGGTRKRERRGNNLVYAYTFPDPNQF